MATTSIAKRTATAVREKPIAELVAEIHGHIDDADRTAARCHDHRLKAGQKLLRLRQRIEAGEEGAVDWWEWCAVNIQRSRKDCERLMRFAGANDPEAALEAERAKDRDRKRRERKEQIEQNFPGADVRSIKHVEAGCCSGTFVTVVEAEEPNKRRRRADAEIERLIRFTDFLDFLPIPEPSDTALDLLPEAERHNEIEIMKRHLAAVKALLDRYVKRGTQSTVKNCRSEVSK